MTKFIGFSLAICAASSQGLIAFALVSLTSVQAQTTKPMNSVPRPTINLRQQSKKPLIFKTPPPPPNIGAPGQRKAGGSRGCLNANVQNTQLSQKALTALAPEYSDSQLVLGSTTQTRPTFWFYVPYNSSSAYAKLVLEDEKDQIIYKTDLTGTPGVVSVSLPSRSEALKIGKRYHWYFNIYCKQDNQFLTSVEGNVQLEALNPTLESELNKATPQGVVALYAANGIWYEALTTLANLRRTSPQNTNFASDWASLLGSVGLQNIAAEPIVNCCKPQDGIATTK